MRRTAITLVSLALAAALTAATPAVAGEVAEPPTAGKPKVLATGLLSPLSLAVTPRGGVWFSQNFAGQLMRGRPGRDPVVKYQHPRGAEVGAVSFRHGVVMFATTGNKGKAVLKKLGRSGNVSNLANLSRYEQVNNPDGGTTYGIDLPDGCRWPRRFGPAQYDGIVESHPYASLQTRGTTYVADAAANAIIGVARNGVVSTVAVLPAMPAVITQEAADANGIPDCAVGETYFFEPVPTDVEMHGGWLYVTTLPGGPEDPSLGRRGAIHRIDPSTGDIQTLVENLLSPTGLAVAGNGDMYVAELFRNRISRVANSGTEAFKWAPAMLPGDVEFRNGRVWATRRVLTGLEPGSRPTGQVVRYPR